VSERERIQALEEKLKQSEGRAAAQGGSKHARMTPPHPKQ
jgi:hypothetical protein